MHWSNPPHLIPVIEVVKGDQTTKETVDTTVAIVESLAMVPGIVDRDVPGFVENRILYAVMREALHLLDEGVASAEAQGRERPDPRPAATRACIRPNWRRLCASRDTLWSRTAFDADESPLQSDSGEPAPTVLKEATYVAKSRTRKIHMCRLQSVICRITLDDYELQEQEAPTAFRSGRPRRPSWRARGQDRRYPRRARCRAATRRRVAVSRLAPASAERQVARVLEHHGLGSLAGCFPLRRRRRV